MENKDKDYCYKIVANWLKNYDNDVMLKVMKNYDNIINDGLCFKLLSVLYEEETKEFDRFITDIKYMSICGIESSKDLVRVYSSAKDLRKLLYDLYIK